MKTATVHWFKRLWTLAAVGFFVFVGWSFFLVFINDPYNDWWFDEKIWKAKSNANGDKMDNPRSKMVYDLQQRLLKPKMTKKQVLALLGPSERRESDTSLGYYIGYGTSPILGGIDPEIFVIEFDESDRLTETHWYQT